MKELHSAPLQRAEDFTVGERARVHAFGHWYVGEVVKVGRSRVTVRYTNGVGNTREKTENPSTPYAFTKTGGSYRFRSGMDHDTAAAVGAMIQKLS